MSIKVQLVELCANRGLPMAEYKKLPSFLLMEKESDIIEKLEIFHLPEITKLICGSDILFLNPWAMKYEKIKPLYCNPEQIDVIQVILGSKTATAFESDILRFADAKILHIFRKYYDDLIALQEAKRKERTKLTKRISAAKKKAEEAYNESDEEGSSQSANVTSENKELEVTQVELVTEPTADEKKLEGLKTELAKLDKYLKQHKSYIEKIRAYESRIQEADSDDNREKAYRSLNDVKMPHEETFLKNFIATGVVSEEYHSQFHDQSFVDRLLQCLDKGIFKDYAIPILLKLYDEGAIDLVEGPASEFISQHPERLCEYLIENTPHTLEDLDNPEIELLIEKALQKEVEGMECKKIAFFSDFWNTITDCNVWNWIIAKINTIIDGENINTAVSCLMIQLKGKAAKSLVETLFNNSDVELKISAIEAISTLMGRNCSSEKDVLIESMRLLEQSNRKVQRRLNTSERKLRSQGQELFSSIYLPMEQLEELSINLKLTDGDIKASLVASHLIDIVISLREGLEALDVQPIVDMDDWKYQNEVAFNSSIHRVTAEGTNCPETVKLKSLGFRYQNDDGEWQQHNAQASVEVDLPIPKKEMRKGYPKYEKPGRKKSNGPSRYTVSKKPKKVVNQGGGTQKKSRPENKKKN